MLAFVASYFHLITLSALLLASGVIILHYYAKLFFARIPRNSLPFVAIAVHVMLALVAAGIQYSLWAGNGLTKNLVQVPLPDEVPLGVFEFLRPILAGEHGYFIFYVLGRYFLELLVLAACTGMIVGLLVIWKKYSRTSFQSGDIWYITTALLLAGWPRMILLMPAVLLVALVFEVVAAVSAHKVFYRLPALFLYATVILLITGKYILEVLNLYTLLAL